MHIIKCCSVKLLSSNLVLIMRINVINIIKWAALLTLPLAFTNPVSACQNYPCKPIKLVVPSEPGGGIDSMARMLAQVFSVRLKTDVVVMNKPGAFGAVGAVWTSKAPEDGYTLLVNGLSHVSTPVLSERAPYDAVQDFVPIAKIAEAPHVLLVNSELPVSSLADLTRLARQRIQGVTYAAAGGATSFAAESFKQRAGGNWLHVPYKGSAQALRSTMTGETDLIFVASQLAQTALESGRVKALAISHPKRLDYLPAVPTLRELGYDDVDTSQWYGVFAPAGTPVAVIDVLDKAIREELMPGGLLQKYIQSNRMEPAYLAKQNFKIFLQEQTKRIKQLNIEIEN